MAGLLALVAHSLAPGLSGAVAGDVADLAAYISCFISFERTPL